MDEPWVEPTLKETPNPLAGATDRLGALRRNITGKLNEATAKLAEAKGFEPPPALGQKLEEVKRDLGNSTLGMVTKGVVRGLQGTPSTEPVREQPSPEEALAFSRQAFLDQLAALEQEAAAASRKRMAFIVAYMRNPGSNPLFEDRPLMYKILSDEREHQQKVLVEASGQLAKLPPTPQEMGMSDEEVAADPRLVAQEQRRAALKKQDGEARTIQAQIFKLLQKLTGVQNAGAGMDFVAERDAPQVAADAPVSEALDAVSQLLAKRKKPG